MKQAILTIFGTLLLSATLAAAPATGAADAATYAGKTLTLDQCIDLALNRNPVNRSLDAGLRAAEENIGEARAPYYPEVGLSSAWRRWQTHAFLPNIPVPNLATSIGPIDDYSAGVSGQWTLFDSGARKSRLEAARRARDSVLAGTVGVRQDLALQVEDTYYRLVAAYEGLDAAREDLKRAEAHRQLAVNLHEAGAAPKADVTRARVLVADARLGLVRAENLVHVRTGALNTLMGLPVETAVKVQPPAEPIPAPPVIDAVSAMDTAVEQRVEVTADRDRVREARQTIRGAKSAYGPTVYAAGKLGWRDSKFWPTDSDWSVGVTLELPLFNGFAREHRLRGAHAELDRRRAELDTTIQSVRQQVWTAHLNVRESAEALNQARAMLADARESLRLTRARYEAGAGTFTDLIDAETSLSHSEFVVVNSRMDFRVALAAFHRATGELSVPTPTGSPAGTQK